MTESDPIFAALARATGARLFTVTARDPEAGLFRRIWTSHPEAYPVSGTKPALANDWSRQVIDAGKSFVANRTADFAPYFADHALINALGCHSVLNAPVRRADGEVVGTLNSLDVEDWFTPARVARIEALVAADAARLASAMQQATAEGY